MADGKTGQTACSFSKQQRVAEIARRDGADFGAQIETFVDLIGQRAAGLFGFRSLIGRQFGIACEWRERVTGRASQVPP